MSQRIVAPPTQEERPNLEQLKSQLRHELQQDLMGEVREQMKTLSANLMEEVRTQLMREPSSALSDRPTTGPTYTSRQGSRSAYQWDTEGNHPGLAAFKTTMPLVQSQAWVRAFAECRRIAGGESLPPYQGQVKLPRQQPVIIPPQTEMLVWTQVSEGAPKQNCNVMIESLPDSGAEWCVGRTLAVICDGRVPVRLCNPNPYPVEIPQRQPLAQVTEVATTDIQGERELVFNNVTADVVEVEVRHIGVEDTSGPHPAVTLQGDGLTPDQQGELTKLLHKWSKTFACHDEDFGCTSVVKHQIPTGSAPPSRERYRTVPPSLYTELRTLLQNMLTGGVVRESASPWAAPIVLVKKKDGSWRFCVDYRRLNACTHKDAYPLPRIEEALTGLKAARWYSTLDLASGYWQVEMHPMDREKTAFTTPFGLYEFNRMPFGLCNAPATFQRLMQRCLGNLVNDFLLIYLDDVVVFSPDFRSHLRHLEEVFRCLHEHGLKLQPTKCRLFQREVTYLGHVISEQGVSTDPEKTIAVRDWPIPQTVKQVKSFLGFAGYYRRFIPAFSKIALPLNALTHGTTTQSKNAPITWTPECQRAFDQLREALLTTPVLAYADFSQPFRLYTDASLDGLGAVLAQVQKGRERVIAYASRSLQPTERNDQNYSSFKLELLALKWAVTEKFKDYLYGAEFTVFTDNNPLVHLETARLGAVEQRWAAQLANFRYVIKYRPGAQNKNADALSRLPEVQDQTPFLAGGAVVEEPPGAERQDSMPPLTSGAVVEEQSWADRQAGDPELRLIRQRKEQGLPPLETNRRDSPYGPQSPGTATGVALFISRMNRRRKGCRRLLNSLLSLKHVKLAEGSSVTTYTDSRIQVSAALPHPARGLLHTLQPGDFVVIRNFRRENWQSKRWQGPFQVLLVTHSSEDGILGRLHRETGTGGEVFQVVVPKRETKEVWGMYHDKMGHPSGERTLTTLQRRCYWPRMNEDVREWTAACPQCVCAKAGAEVKVPLLPILTSYPFEVVGVDYLSLGRPEDRHPYILVITDLFSKYALAVPTRDQSANTTAQALYNHLIQTFGCPERILTDRGATFESSVMKELCQLYGCLKSRTTAYHPQGNGACERFNQTLLGLLNSLEEVSQAQWPSRLPALVQAYNNTLHSTTGMTPHFVGVWKTCQAARGLGSRVEAYDGALYPVGLGRNTKEPYNRLIRQQEPEEPQPAVSPQMEPMPPPTVGCPDGWQLVLASHQRSKTRIGPTTWPSSRTGSPKREVKPFDDTPLYTAEFGSAPSSGRGSAEAAEKPQREATERSDGETTGEGKRNWWKRRRAEQNRSKRSEAKETRRIAVAETSGRMGEALILRVLIFVLESSLYSVPSQCQLRSTKTLRRPE
ncbi:uncharacterized protein LOC116686492 [Etheostoma spectabile]|uniref:uncharacterized protein LOC116686492 n=1 Tax=Etheostoma spectabile TaxID=54343 RepID=UPI0013AED1A4|nr:uncharacterized protein LOC116686492 [Etheostoma spectabile]